MPRYAISWPNVQSIVNTVDTGKKAVEPIKEKEFRMATRGVAYAAAQVVVEPSVALETDADEDETKGEANACHMPRNAGRHCRTGEGVQPLRAGSGMGGNSNLQTL